MHDGISIPGLVSAFEGRKGSVYPAPAAGDGGAAAGAISRVKMCDKRRSSLI